MTIESDLIENFKEFYASAAESLNNGRFNSATDSFFKALVVLCDIAIYRRLRILPSNHTERFNILQVNFTSFYQIVDGLFGIYRRSYTIRMKKENAERIKKGVDKIAEALKIKIS